jgi:hypothetical protein
MKVREGNDFASQVLVDAWDLEEYSDISRYINESNVMEHLTNIQVNGGRFSATTASNDPQFYTLFPGYRSSIDSTNIPVKSGDQFPIDSSKYHCFYMRIKVETPITFDDMRVYWFGSDYLANGSFGVTQRIPLEDQNWHLYSIDLNSNFDPQNANTPWSGLSEWQGIRIDPAKYAGVNFSVDWVRLTDCQSVNTNVSWKSTSGDVEIWAGIGTQSLDFQIATVSGSLGQYAVDVQGWEPGSYYLGVKNANGVSWSSQPITIDPAPQIRFKRPYFDTGDKYVWDMDSAADLDTHPLAGTRCVDYSFQDGILNLLTLPATDLPSDCVNTLGGNMLISDPQLVLNMPAPSIDTTRYRYLTIRTYMDGMVQDINRGWMFRWIWKVYKNNDPNQWCINVSDDIVFDPGWQTIVVDLHDPVSGTTEDFAGPANCTMTHWTSAPAQWLRFDVNENATASTFHQMIDYISLSSIDRVKRGARYPISITSTEDLDSLNLSFYYTTDRSNPTQHEVKLAKPASVPSGGYSVFLPFTLHTAPDHPVTAPSGTGYSWDTSGVAAGEYYVCVQANDGLNTTTQCSLAPMQIVP